jgi:hypothetical protein
MPCTENKGTSLEIERLVVDDVFGIVPLDVVKIEAGGACR